MRSFSELAGADLHWEFDGSTIVPDTGDRHYVLFSGSEPVVTAQSKWERLVYYEVALEAGEGTYFVHMDLTASPLTAVVWKAGTSFSAAGFSLTAWSSSAFAGAITTAGGRTLTWRPKTILGMPSQEGLLVAADGTVLLSVAAKSGSATSGKMRISPALAADPDRAALSALAFALCNEQGLFLHLAPGLAGNGNYESRLRYRLRAPRPDDGVGAVGAVVPGKLGVFILLLFLGTMTLWIFSVALWSIDFFLLFVVVIGLMFRSGTLARTRATKQSQGRYVKGQGYLMAGGGRMEGPLVDLVAGVNQLRRDHLAREAAAEIAPPPHDDPLEASRDDGVVSDAQPSSGNTPASRTRSAGFVSRTRR